MYTITDIMEYILSTNANDLVFKDKVSPYELFKLVKDNDKLLEQLCAAVINTYDNMEHARKFLR